MISIQTVKITAQEYMSFEVCNRIKNAVVHFAKNQAPPGKVLSDEHQARCKALVTQICGDLEGAATVMYKEFIKRLEATENARVNMHSVHLQNRPLQRTAPELVVTQCWFPSKSLIFFSILTNKKGH